MRGIQHLDTPALFLRELAVHAEQFIGEQRRFFAAGAGANFEHDVLLIVRILRDQQLPNRGQQHVAPLFEPAQFLDGELAHVGVAALGQLRGLRGLLDDRLVFAEALHERLHVAERLRMLAIF